MSRKEKKRKGIEKEVSDDQILKILEEAEINSKWVTEKYDELKRMYEGMVFAVKDKKVIHATETMEELLDEMEKRDENMAFLLIESVPSSDLSFIL